MKNDAGGNHTTILQRRFYGAIDFLKKQEIAPEKKIFDLPWIFVLGTERTDKNKVLKYAGLEYILKKKNENITRSHCSWLATKELVLIDINQEYCVGLSDDKETEKKWNDFLRLIQKNKQSPIYALWLMIDLETLLQSNKNSAQSIASLFKNRVADLCEKFGQNFPVYLTITKLNILKGFSDFFDDFSTRERNQPWGIYFTPKEANTKQAYIENFETQFNSLLQNLNERIIKRLHQERNLEKRVNIKDFPLQMESIKKPLSAFLNEAFLSTRDKSGSFFLRGIFFVATSTSTTITEDRLLQPLLKTFQLETYFESTAVPTQSDYFIKSLVKEVILPDARFFHHANEIVEDSSHKKLTYLSIFCITVIIFGFCAFLFHHYFFTNNIIRQTDDALSQYELLTEIETKFNLKENLLALNKLNEAYEMALNAKKYSFLNGGNVMALTEKTEILYSQALQKFILTQFQTILALQVAKNPIDPSTLYGVLKGSMMLSDKKHYDERYLRNWLLHYWEGEGHVTKNDIAMLNNHLNNFFLLFKPTEIEANQSLIFTAREKLSKIPTATLINVMLENNSQQAPLTLPLSIFSGKETTLEIPSIYTATQFEHIYDEVLPQIAMQLKQGDWVTGQNESSRVVDEDVLMKIREQYIADYIQHWRFVIRKLKLGPMTSYQQVLQLIQAFTTPDPIIVNIMKTIYENTNISYHNVPTPISETFSRLDKIIYLYNKNDNKNLLALKSLLESVVNSQTRSQTALLLMETQLLPEALDNPFNHLQKIAEVSPEPINTWINTLLKNSAILLLDDASSEVNSAWNNTIFQFFEDNLANRYPFNQTSVEDADLASVNKLLGRAGLFHQFYETKLMPFLEKKSDGIALKNFYGATLPLSLHGLKEITALSLLSTTFYTDDSPDDFSFDFIFSPEKISDNVKSVSINFDNQIATFSQEFVSSMHIVWPGKTVQHAASLVFTDNQGSQQPLAATGPWAIFRLLETSPDVQIAAVDNKMLEALLKSGMNQLGYALSTETGINPFGNGVLLGFTLSPQIISNG